MTFTDKAIVAALFAATWAICGRSAGTRISAFAVWLVIEAVIISGWQP